MQRIQVASVTNEVIQAALKSAITDFEDAVTSEAANAADVEIIVTRNISDFLVALFRSRNATRGILDNAIGAIW